MHTKVSSRTANHLAFPSAVVDPGRRALLAAGRDGCRATAWQAAVPGAVPDERCLVPAAKGWQEEAVGLRLKSWERQAVVWRISIQSISTSVECFSAL